MIIISFIFQNYLIERALVKNNDVIIDNTNLKQRYINDFLKTFNKYLICMLFSEKLINSLSFLNNELNLELSHSLNEFNLFLFSIKFLLNFC